MSNFVDLTQDPSTENNAGDKLRTELREVEKKLLTIRQQIATLQVCL